MEFRKLQYFESVARWSSFTKAAEELHVAQPTITAAIKKMEEELGSQQDWTVNLGIVPKVITEPVQMIAVYSLVQHNVGISFAVGDVYQDMIRTEDIVSIPLAQPAYCETGFVWKKGKKLGRAARKCLDYVLEQSKVIQF